MSPNGDSYRFSEVGVQNYDVADLLDSLAFQSTALTWRACRHELEYVVGTKDVGS